MSIYQGHVSKPIMNTNSPRLQPMRALKAVRQLVRTPENTELVFEIMEALKGRATIRNTARLRRLRPELLLRGDDMLDVLCDRDSLAALPDGSLSREYLAFCKREGISPEGLVEASSAAPSQRDQQTPEGWFTRRMRDTHDLYHVITGYNTTPEGEIDVVTFSYAQSRHLGFGLIGLMGALNSAKVVGYRAALGRWWRAYRHGRRAAWLPGQDWAALMPLPLAEVRKALDISVDPGDVTRATFQQAINA